ncbi:hypothetical protein, partial [Xanthovirga aplysinae]|uniref:hypothetical protein n=1 Tax=Xanthovirga aplysinae TaxID=2529853 RepID=UPI001656CD94
MLRDILLSEKAYLIEALEEHFHLSPTRAEEISDLAINYVILEFEAELAKDNWSLILNLLNGKEEVVNSSLAQLITIKLATELMVGGELSPSEATSFSQFFMSFMVHQINVHSPKEGWKKSDLEEKGQLPNKENILESWLKLKDKLSRFF